MFRAVVGAGAGSQLVPALGMYCAMSGLLDMTLLLSLDLGLPLAMPFNWPHLSASLSEFWGRRWNLSQSDLLKVRVLVLHKCLAGPPFSDQRS